MAEFKAIETQEELDKIIQGRVGKLNTKISTLETQLEENKGYKDKFEELEKQLTASNKSIEDMKNKYEEKLQSQEDLKKEVENLRIRDKKVTIALASGLPYEFSERLQGETEEELEIDAKKLSGYFTQPLKTTENKKESESERLFGNLI